MDKQRARGTERSPGNAVVCRPVEALASTRSSLPRQTVVGLVEGQDSSARRGVPRAALRVSGGELASALRCPLSRRPPAPSIPDIDTRRLDLTLTARFGLCFTSYEQFATRELILSSATITACLTWVLAVPVIAGAWHMTVLYERAEAARVPPTLSIRRTPRVLPVAPKPRDVLFSGPVFMTPQPKPPAIGIEFEDPSKWT